MGSPVGKNRPTWSRGGFRGVPDLKIQKLARHSNLGAPCRRHARAASSTGTPWSPHGPGDGSSIVCIALSHMQTLESIGRSHDGQLRPGVASAHKRRAAVATKLMTSASLCLSRVIRSESMITLNVVTRADDERSTGPTRCHCQCCLCETALEGRIRKIPTPTSIVRHRRMHGINNTSSTVNRHASPLHEHAFSSPSHVSCAAVYFNTWAQKVNLAGSAFMIDGTSGSKEDMCGCVLITNVPTVYCSLASCYAGAYSCARKTLVFLARTRVKMGE